MNNLKRNWVSSFLLSLADGWRTDIDVEFPIVIVDIGLYFSEIRHCERHEISWHQQRRSKMIPIEIFHSIPATKKKLVEFFLKRKTTNCKLHFCGVDQRHVGESHHIAMTSKSDSKNSLHVWLVEAWKNSSGVSWLHLWNGHVPE